MIQLFYLDQLNSKNIIDIGKKNYFFADSGYDSSKIKFNSNYSYK